MSNQPRRTIQAQKAPPLETSPPIEERLVSAVASGLSFTDAIEIRSWRSKLSDTLQMFGEAFTNALGCSEFVQPQEGNPKENASQLISELTDILKESLKEAPLDKIQDFARQRRDRYGPTPMSEVWLEKKDEELPAAEQPTQPEGVKVDEVQPEDEVPEAIAPEPSNPTESPEPSEINASQSKEFNFLCPATIEARGKGRPPKALANKTLFSGVLFRIDEASEVAPSKGSSLPLFVPMSVAQSVAEQISASGGLPLDAHASLSQHQSDSILGVMTSAEIVGNDFVVHGHLFPWNQSEKVSKIKEHQELLGMSMNANVIGHEDVVGDTAVLVIQEMEMLGANILLQDRATYGKTRIIEATVMAEKSTSTPTPDETGEHDMDIKELTESIQGLISATQVQAESTNKQIELIQAQMKEQSALVQDLAKYKADQEAAKAAAKAQAEQQVVMAQKEEETSKLLEAVRSEFEKALTEALPPSRRQPVRAVPPAGLVSVGGGGSDRHQEVMASKMTELARLEGALDFARSSGGNNTDRIRLAQEVRQLQIELGVAV